MRKQLIELQRHLVQGMVARDEMIKSALLAVLAGENVVLIGPPGTGKSLLARRISQAMQDNRYFEYLLTKFSTPEELFGPLSISELKQDRFRRNTEGYLPSVHLAFLDEIFKASSSILNSLLTLLNERTYHNGAVAEKTPLQSIIAASNELPNGKSELEALYDRFLIRCFVGYLDSNQRAELLNLPPMQDVPMEARLSAEMLAQIRQTAKTVKIPQQIADILDDIWQRHQEQFKDNADEQLSDRRFVKILNILRVSAATNDRDTVDMSDVLLLKDCLWNNKENEEAVKNLILDVLKQHDRWVVDDKNGNINTQTQAQIKKQTETITAPKVAPKGRKINGLKGRGTEQNPFLIENLLHLKMLARPDIGAKGYYFRQTADIDCSGLDENTWLNIKTFSGHYNGSGFSITGNRNIYGGLFNNVENATIQYIHLINLQMVADWEEYGVAKNSHIYDCSFDLKDYNSGFSGIEAIENSQIERCYAQGSLTADWYGLVCYCEDHSTIWDCAVGQVTIDSKKGGFYGRITDELSADSSLANNISISSNTRWIDSDSSTGQTANGRNGENISSELFNQAYFENMLGWDFNNVWQWNNTENRLQLRQNITVKNSKLLIKQINNNIWLRQVK